MVTDADFTNGPLADHGVTVSRTPVTRTNDNVTGDLERSDGTPVNIQAVFTNPQILHQLEQEGEIEDSEVIVAVKGDVTINKEDKLAWNSYVFRVTSVSPRYFGSNLIFKKVITKLITKLITPA